MTRMKKLISLPELKDQGKNWFVVFSVRNPKTDKLQRFRIYEGFNKATNDTERRKIGTKLITEYTNKLNKGWTPFDDAKYVYENHLSYGYVASQNYDKIKKSNRTVSFTSSKFFEMKKPNLAKKSYSTYLSKLRIFESWCKKKHLHELDISAITNDHIKAFFNYLIIEKDRDKVTVKKYLQIMNTYFNWMVDKYNIKNPIFEITLPQKKVDNAARPIIKSDLIQLLDTTEKNDPQLYLAMLMQYYTAIRPGNELLNLKIKDIDFYNNKAVVSNVYAKTTGRIITLPKPLVEIMTKQFLLQTFNTDFYIFGRNRVPGPQKMGMNTLRNRFNQIRDRLNLPTHYKFYSMKHTGAGMLLDCNRTLPEVMDWMGHKSLEYTEHYVKRHFGMRNLKVINEFPDPRS